MDHEDTSGNFPWKLVTRHGIRLVTMPKSSNGAPVRGSTGQNQDPGRISGGEWITMRKRHHVTLAGLLAIQLIACQPVTPTGLMSPASGAYPSTVSLGAKDGGTIIVRFNVPGSLHTQ